MAADEFDRLRAEEAAATIGATVTQIVEQSMRQLLVIREMLKRGETADKVRQMISAGIAKMIATMNVGEFPIVVFAPGKGTKGYKVRLLTPESAAQQLIEQAQDAQILAK